MALTPVKAASGRRVRDPRTMKPLPSVDDANTAAVQVDLANPLWYRRHRDGDIVVVENVPAQPAPAAAAATSNGSTQTGAAASSAAQPAANASATAAPAAGKE